MDNHAFLKEAKNAMTASTLTRFLANIFVFLVLLAALAVAIWDLVNGRDIPLVVQGVLTTGLGYALHVLGVNHGVTLEPIKSPQNQPKTDA
jgi:hypothetical protein